MGKSERDDAQRSEECAVEDLVLLQAQLCEANAKLGCSKGTRSTIKPHGELQAAWDDVVGPGLERLRIALVAAGVHAPPQRTAQHKRPPPSSTAQSELTRQPTERRLSKHKKEKKDGKKERER